MRRRDFLAAGALATTAPLSKILAQAAKPTAHVVEVTSDFVVRGRLVHEQVLHEMIASTLTHLTGKSNVREAWKSILKPDDVIGLKCNSSGAEGLGVSESFLDVVIGSLMNAGFEGKQIVVIEAPETTYRTHDVVKPALGWSDKPVTFASGSDQLASWLDQVTAIVNIPFIKTHNIAGMTCTMKNLSHAVVKHPARYHGRGCSPFIGDIYALDAVRKKVRLHLVNGLRIVYDGGPDTRDAGIWDAGLIFGSTDPVATDVQALASINSQRSMLGLPTIANQSIQTPYLPHAAQLGLGTTDPFRTRIERVRI